MPNRSLIYLLVLLIAHCDAFFGFGRNEAALCEPPCVAGDESIMSDKEHGTSHTPVQVGKRSMWFTSIILGWTADIHDFTERPAMGMRLGHVRPDLQLQPPLRGALGLLGDDILPLRSRHHK